MRGSDQLVVFPVDGQGRVAGRCDVASGGKGPRHFSLSPDGRFLAVANLASDDVRLFERDADGMLRAVAVSYTHLDVYKRQSFKKSSSDFG